MSPKAIKTSDRFARVISTPAGLDATLATVCYTSLLLHTQFSNSRTPSRLANLSPAFRNLYNLLEDTRVYTRLTGLVALYTAIRETWAIRQHDVVSDILLRSSLLAVTTYQVLENIALLVQHNVLRSRRLKPWEGWFWTTSNRFWLAALFCDLARLARARQLGFEDDSIVAGNDAATEEGHESLSQVENAVDLLRKQWWQELLMTAASLPMAVNWSFAEGESPVNETLVAGAGLVGGLIMLKDAVKDAL